MDFDIKLFDDYRENNRLEAKKARGGLPNSLWDTYSAMANCYGGVILLGVIEREDGSCLLYTSSSIPMNGEAVTILRCCWLQRASGNFSTMPITWSR